MQEVPILSSDGPTHSHINTLDLVKSRELQGWICLDQCPGDRWDTNKIYGAIRTFPDIISFLKLEKMFWIFILSLYEFLYFATYMVWVSGHQRLWKACISNRHAAYVAYSNSNHECEGSLLKGMWPTRQARLCTRSQFIQSVTMWWWLARQESSCGSIKELWENVQGDEDLVVS